MDPVANPFRPGAGRRPPLLAGRAPLLAAFETIRRRAEDLGEADRSWILNGLRGVGKTALLNELLAHVSASPWITAKVEAGTAPSLGVGLTQALTRGMRTATGRHPEPRLKRLLQVVKAFSLTFDPSGAVSVGIDVTPARGVADSGHFAADLTALFDELGQTARTLGIGVLVLLDELQEATASDLSALNQAVHHVGQAVEPWPLTVVGAGLPSLPAQLAEATSYAERLWEYKPVGLLDDDAAHAALTVPARERGVEWSGEALALAVSTAHGYPYFLQAIGKHVWDNARRSPIRLDDAEVGLRAASQEVDDGLYRSRWERATPVQRELMRALAAECGDAACAIADVARRMGRTRASDISVPRNELIKKGLVYAPERGLLAFTVPGMHDFIDRQP